MRLFVPIALALALTGCGSLNPFGPGQELAVPTSLSETGQEAAKIINGVKVGLIVFNNTVKQKASEQLLLKSEATAAGKWIDERWKEVKEAEKVLDDGKDILAKGQAELLEKVLDKFQRELLEKAAARAAARKKGSA